MYDDTNWCLVCECHVDGSGPFCSTHCQAAHCQAAYGDNDDDQVIYHHVAHSRTADIIAWATQIPPTCNEKLTNPLPKLLRSNRHPAPPALSVSVPPFLTPSSPTRPISTHKSSAFSSSVSLASISDHSLLSAPTESSLATPTSTLPLPIPSNKSSLLGALASHVRSWVASSPASPLVVSQTYDSHSILSQQLHTKPESTWKVSAIIVDPPRPRGRKTSRT